MWQVSAWQTKLLQHIARSTQTQCKLAYKDCIAARTDEFIADASESNSAPARNLAKRLKLARTRPRIASAPVLDKQGVPITSSKDWTCCGPSSLLRKFQTKFCLLLQSNSDFALQTVDKQRKRWTTRLGYLTLYSRICLPQWTNGWTFYCHVCPRCVKAKQLEGAAFLMDFTKLLVKEVNVCLHSYSVESDGKDHQ